MKTLYIVLGSISLGLGILGIFLPLLHTTPFLLLTAALYFKGSPRLYNWLLNHRHFGPYISNFRENTTIPLLSLIHIVLTHYIKSVDTEYFGELYNRYIPLTYGLCLKYLQDEDQAQEAVMQMFEDLLPKIILSLIHI